MALTVALFLFGGLSAYGQDFFLRHEFMGSPCSEAGDCNDRLIKCGGPIPADYDPYQESLWYNQGKPDEREFRPQAGVLHTFHNGLPQTLHFSQGHCQVNLRTDFSELGYGPGAVDLYQGLSYRVFYLPFNQAVTTAGVFQDGTAQPAQDSTQVCYQDTVLLTAGAAMNQIEDGSPIIWEVKYGNQTFKRIPSWTGETLQTIVFGEELLSLLNSVYGQPSLTHADLIGQPIYFRAYAGWTEGIKGFFNTEALYYGVNDLSAHVTTTAACDLLAGSFEIEGIPALNTQYTVNILSLNEGPNFYQPADTIVIYYQKGQSKKVDILDFPDFNTGERFYGDYRVYIEPDRGDTAEGRVQECAYLTEIHIDHTPGDLSLSIPGNTQATLCGDEGLDITPNVSGNSGTTLTWTATHAGALSSFSSGSQNQTDIVSSRFGDHTFTLHARYTASDFAHCNDSVSHTARFDEDFPSVSGLTVATSALCADGSESTVLSLVPTVDVSVSGANYQWATRKDGVAINLADVGSSHTYTFQTTEAADYTFSWMGNNGTCTTSVENTDGLTAYAPVGQALALSAGNNATTNGVFVDGDTVCSFEPYLHAVDTDGGDIAGGVWRVTSANANQVTFRNGYTQGMVAGIAVAQPGTYTFEYTLARDAAFTSGECHVAGSLTLTFLGAATPTIQVGTDAFCDFVAVPLSITTPSGYDSNDLVWQVKTPGAENFTPLSGAADTSYTFDIADVSGAHPYGAYTVRYRWAHPNPVCTGIMLTDEATLRFDAPPAAPSITQIAPVNDTGTPGLCGEVTQFDLAATVPETGHTLEWTFTQNGDTVTPAGNFSITTPRASFNALDYGYYDVTYTVTNGLCAASTADTVPYLGPLATPRLTTRNGCSDVHRIFVNGAAERGQVYYRISNFPVGASPFPTSFRATNSSRPSLSGITENGTYTVEMYLVEDDPDGGCPNSATISRTFTRNSIDEPNILTDGDTIFACSNTLSLSGSSPVSDDVAVRWTISEFFEKDQSSLTFSSTDTESPTVSFTQPGLWLVNYSFEGVNGNTCPSTHTPDLWVYYTGTEVQESLTTASCPPNALAGPEDGTITLNTPVTQFLDWFSLPEGGNPGDTLSYFPIDYSFAWNHDAGLSDSIATGLKAGDSYTYTVTESVSGCKREGTVAMQGTTDFTLTTLTSAGLHNGQDLSCFGATDGTLAASFAGGNGGYSLLLKQGGSVLDSHVTANSPETFGGLGAGSYTLELQDQEGCVYAENLQLSDPQEVSFTQAISGQDYNGFGVSCSGLTDGALELSVSGGTLAGSGYTYTLEEVDAMGTVLRSLGNFANQSGNNNAIPNLGAGRYRVQATDANGCIAATPPIITITEPTAVSFAAAITSDYTGFGVSCGDLKDGELTITANGGVTDLPYDLILLPIGPSNNERGRYTELLSAGVPLSLDTLGKGEVRVVVRDANRCLTSEFYTLTAAELPLVTFTQTQFYEGEDLACFGDSNGEITLGISGVTGPYTYQLYRNDSLYQEHTAQTTDRVYSGLPSGSYYVLVTDNNGCSVSTTTVNLLEPRALTTTAQRNFKVRRARNGWDVSCADATDGVLVTAISGGTIPSTDYTVQWSGPNGFTSSLRELSDLEAGTYTVTVTDNNGCTAQSSATLLAPSPLVLTDSTTTNPLCAYSFDGTLLLNARGGVLFSSGGYRFGYTEGGVSVNEREQLGPITFFEDDGTFVAYVEDANGCRESATLTLVDPTRLTLDILSSQPINCYDGDNGTVTAVATLGDQSQPYAFELWNGDSGSPDTLTFAGTDTVRFMGLRANRNDRTYLRVTDAIGCIDTTSLALEEPDPLQLSLVKTVLPDCHGDSDGRLRVRATGGVGTYGYSIDSLNFEVNGFREKVFGGLSGNAFYDVWVRDANFLADQPSCTQKFTFPLGERDPVTIAGTVDPVTCFGGSDGQITLSTATGGAGNPSHWTYQWTDLNSGDTLAHTRHLNALPLGQYGVRVLDSLACEASETFAVAEPLPLQTDVTLLETRCVTSEITGRIRVLVQGGNQPDYEVSVDGGTWLLAPGGALAIDGLTQGLHTITTRPQGNTGCTDETTIRVESPNLEFSLTGSTNPICAADTTGTITLLPNGSGTYTYRADTATQVFQNSRFFTGLAAGTYAVTLRDEATGCVSLPQVVTLTDPAAFTVTASLTYNASCDAPNGQATAEISRAGTFSPFDWVNAANGIPVDPGALNAGTYAVSVTSETGCVRSDTVTVGLDPNPAYRAVIVQDAGCNANLGTLTLVADQPGAGTISYQWSHTAEENDTLFGLPAGEYFATITDARGCVDTARATLRADPVVQIQAMVTPSLCNDPVGSMALAPQGGTGPYTVQWPDAIAASTDFTALNLAADRYALSVTDAAGCVTDTLVLVNALGEPDSVGVTASDATCGLPNGSLRVDTVFGGTAPHTLTWTRLAGDTLATVALGDTLRDLTAGPYVLLTTDANHCFSGFVYDLVEDPTLAPRIQSVQSLPDTCGMGVGAVTLSLDRGTAPFVATWANEGQALPITGLQATELDEGLVSVSLTDHKGCVVDTTFRLGSVAGPAVSLAGILAPDCSAGGQAEVAVSQGTGPFTYTWSNGDTAPIADSLLAGQNWVLASDQPGCVSDTLFFTMPGGPSVEVVADRIVPASCALGNDGTASVVVLSGTAPYTYAWIDSLDQSRGTDPEALALEAAAYQVTVTDAIGCVDSISISVPQQAIIIRLQSLRDPNCAGAADGRIAVQATGGGTPQYQWFNASGDSLVGETQSTLVTEAGTYTVVAQDSTGCSVSAAYTLTDPDPLVLDLVSALDPSCFGATDGVLEVRASGGDGNYTYTLNGTPASDRATALGAGTYEITVTDGRGCSLSRRETLTAPAAIALDDFTLTAPRCFGEANGSISLNLTNTVGSTLVTYQQDGNAVAADQLQAGPLYLRAEDSRGCTWADTLMVTQPTPLVLDSILIQHPTCFEATNGWAQGLVSGGNGGYSYQWQSNVGGALAAVDSLTGLGAQTLSFLVTDALGCTAQQSNIDITAPPVLSVTATEAIDPLCHLPESGQITLAIQGGTGPYAITWQHDTAANGLTSLTGLTEGDYTAQVTDAAGCLASLSVSLSQPERLSITPTVFAPTCADDADGRVSLSVQGGTGPYSMQWADGSLATTERTGLVAGTYRFTVTDSLGCSQLDSVVVTAPDPVQLRVVTPFAPGCTGDGTSPFEVVATGGNGGFAYQWADGPTGALRPSLSGGAYQVIATDLRGCADTLNTVLSAPAPLVVSVAATDPTCFGEGTGAISFFLTGGDGQYTALWNDDTTTALSRTGLVADTYHVALSDGQGCLLDTTVILDQPTALRNTALTQRDITCAGEANGTLGIAPTGGLGTLTTTWVNAEGRTLGTGHTLTGLSAGIYAYTATDAVGCTLSDTLTIAEPAPLVLTWEEERNETCGGGDGFLAVSASGGNGGYTYQWTGPLGQALGTVAQLENLTAGAYQVSVSDALGCQVQAQSTLLPPQPLGIDSVVLTEPLCRGEASGQIAVFARGGNGVYAAQWSNGQDSMVLTDLAAGVYFLKLQSGTCTVYDTIRLHQPEHLQATTITQRNPSCAGNCDGELAVQATGGVGPYAYSWSSGERTAQATGLCGGIYSVAVQDLNGCTLRREFTLVDPNPLSIQVSTAVDPICYGDSTGMVRLQVSGGTSPFTVAWSSGATGMTWTGAPAGTFTAHVTDARGCAETVSTLLENPLEEVITTLDDRYQVCNGAELILDAGEWATYAWAGPQAFASTERKATISLLGDYDLRVTNRAGCPDEHRFSLEETTEPLTMNVLGPSETYVGDTLVLVDVSWPIPDSGRWTVPNLNVLRLADSAEYQQLVFLDTGYYNVQLEAFRLGCMASEQHTIYVRDASGRSVTLVNNLGAEMLGVREYKVYPNPTNGQATLHLRTGGTQAVQVDVVDLRAGRSVWTTETGGGTLYKIPLRLPQDLRNGLYLVRMQTVGQVVAVPLVLLR